MHAPHVIVRFKRERSREFHHLDVLLFGAAQQQQDPFLRPRLARRLHRRRVRASFRLVAHAFHLPLPLRASAAFARQSDVFRPRESSRSSLSNTRRTFARASLAARVVRALVRVFVFVALAARVASPRARRVASPRARATGVPLNRRTPVRVVVVECDRSRARRGVDRSRRVRETSLRVAPRFVATRARRTRWRRRARSVRTAR
jgi:hypothetical protein